MYESPIIRLPLRIYYEDTDAGGVVYYANYLRFMERARSEWLRSLGLEVVELASREQVLFAVYRAEIDFKAPARLNDQVFVTARLGAIRRAGLSFEQEVSRDRTLLCRAQVKIACVNAVDFRPRPIPESVLLRLNPESVA
ncbi:MAG: tol-pal system-associated acyl-CoA thioesterase [Acidiferrobacteraceae bacterium]